MVFLFPNTFPPTANKVVPKELPGAGVAQTHPSHLWRHQLVLGGQILGVVELINYNLPSLTTLSPTSSSPSPLNQGSNLVVRSQEDHNINSWQIDPQKHFVAAQVQGYL